MDTLKSFKRGIHLLHAKEMTQKINITSMPAPKKVFIPVSQHIGASAEVIVNIGDKVTCGQMIASAKGNISANIFSSISGTVLSIKNRMTPNGKCLHIEIENDGEEGEILLPVLSNPKKEDIINRIREAGIVGMGGAGFPTAVKLTPPEAVDTFIINAAECEPYITCDYRIMLDYSEQFLRGALFMATALGLSHVIIAIEDNKPDAILALNHLIGVKGYDIEVVPLKSKYPGGAEKQLIYSVTKRKVPCGKLPGSIGVIVDNVHTALSVYLAIAAGQPLVKRVMTVTGEGIKTPSNIWVANGTQYKDIIEYLGGLSQKPTVKMISGGPMMGVSVLGDEFVTTKTSGSLLLMSRDEAFTGEPSPCINCGRCARVCPMRLMPMFIDAYSLAGDIDNAVKYGADNCMECGCCAYTCPAKRPLVQSIRLAKNKFREIKAKQKKAKE